MVKQFVPDELWMIIEPLLPPEQSKPNGAGRGFLIERSSLA
jgi:hypothetical protein